MSRGQFSTLHPFTRDEVEQAVIAVAKEAPSKRLLVNVTTAHRRNSIHQWALNQIAFWLIVPAIFLAETQRQSIASSMLYVWSLACLANWTVRALLYYLIFRATPADVSRSIWLRLIPLLIMVISTGHWVWSVHLFVTPVLTATVLVVYVGFVMLTIAGIGNLLATPIAAGAYVGALWLALSVRAVQVDLLPWTLAVTIDVCVAAILWLCVYMTETRLRPHLDRSDQIDLLLAELKRTNLELSQSNSALEVMKNEAATTLEKRSSFFAGASHDFRQRLHAMKLMSHSTMEGLPEGDRSRHALVRLSEEIQELENYITHFLAFAKIEALDEKANPQNVSLLDLFQELDLRFEDIAASHEVRLRFRATRARLRTDPRLLLQMLENLVSNAVKFTRGGVVVASRRRDHGLAIEVWDQGHGIKSDELRKIFDAFHQDPSTAARGERGVGLGLAVVRRFADRLGCVVTVSSRPEKGSVFRIQFPATHVLTR